MCLLWFSMNISNYNGINYFYWIFYGAFLDSITSLRKKIRRRTNKRVYREYHDNKVISRHVFEALK